MAHYGDQTILTLPMYDLIHSYKLSINVIQQYDINLFQTTEMFATSLQLPLSDNVKERII